MIRTTLSLLAALALALAVGAGRSARGDEAAASGRRFEDAFEKRVHEHTLKNGLRLLVLERHEVPVVSFVTMAGVGAVDEHAGITGVAHVFEHMAFKGSRNIGATDPVAEAAALEKLDAAFDALEREKERGARADPEKIRTLEAEFASLQKKAASYVVNNEYSVVVEENGGTHLNASTGKDTTQYYVSFPSNRLELWFYLESDRFKDPVLREFYKEKAVIMEERRSRVDSNPIGKLLEKFTSAAYDAHPYGYPVIGFASDIAHLRRSEAEAFFRKHYVPNNLVVAIVGDVDTARAIELAEKYFAPLPKGPAYEPVVTVEPPQEGEKRVEVESPAQPIAGIGYHRPAASDPDDAVYDVLTDILSSGRTSRFYTRLVKEKQIALQAGAFTGYPGQKYPSLVVLFGLPAIGHTAGELEAALLEEAERLRNEPVSEEELARVKVRARASLIRGLNSNQGIAFQLAAAQTVLGDWREAFRQIRRIDAVTAADVQRVARATFTKRNRTFATIVKPEEGAE